MRIRLTDAIVRALPAPATGSERITYDSGVTGFGVRVTRAGARSFLLNYRTRLGRERRYTIGRFPEWRTSAARAEAAQLKQAVSRGEDPLGEIQRGRAAPTVADLCARFEADYLPRKRPSTQRSYRQQISVDILPAVGRVRVAEVTHADVDALHHRLSARAPIQANRTIALASRLFTLAIRWGWRTDNPCRGTEHNEEHKRRRYLTAAELERLLKALDELRDQGAANVVRLLLLTGARMGELLAARWDDVDLAARVWTKPASTTKQRATHSVPLSEAACRLLTRMREQTLVKDEWLFPARAGGHRQHIDKAWTKLRKAADIPDVRLHDLRHTFASVLASAGLSLPVIGALLGHATPVTTHRYAHLFDDPLRAATERASAIITGEPGADIVPLKGSR